MNFPSSIDPKLVNYLGDFCCPLCLAELIQHSAVKYESICEHQTCVYQVGSSYPNDLDGCNVLFLRIESFKLFLNFEEDTIDCYSFNDGLDSKIEFLFISTLSDNLNSFRPENLYKKCSIYRILL